MSDLVIKVFIKDREVESLLNTGAATSLITEKLAKDLNLKTIRDRNELLINACEYFVLFIYNKVVCPCF